MVIDVLAGANVETAVGLWHEAGLTRPWNDPVEDLQRALAGPSSTVLAGVEGDELAVIAMVGHDGHRGWVYYLAVRAGARGHGRGTAMMRACEAWLVERGVPKINVMVRADNAGACAFYAALGYSVGDVTVMSRSLR